MGNKDPRKEKYGHAVTVVDAGPNYLVMMNSWGENFAKKGYFKVHFDVLEEENYGFEFHDVFYE